MGWSIDLSEWVRKAKGNVGKVKRGAALRLFSSVVLKTPVDTGRARGNWQPSVGTAQSGTSENADKSGAGVIAEIQNAAEKWARSEQDEAIYLVNNLPYIQALEEGHSTQAPHGMVRTTLLEFPGAVEDAVREANG